MPRLDFSTAARESLAGIENYIAAESHNRAIAQRFVERIISKCEHLAALPSIMGRPRPELLPDMRSFPFVNYVIFFRYTADTFYIIDILHGSRDIDSYFSENEDEMLIEAILAEKSP